MTSSALSSQSTTFRANQDHPGINLVIIGTLILVVIVLFILILRIFPSWLGGARSDYWIVATIFSLLIGAGIIAVLDPVFKRLWPSGHTLTFDVDQVVHGKPDQTRTEIHLQQDHTTVYWHHAMRGYARFGRERQLRNGTFCVACQLQQGEETIVVQSFLNPRQYFRLKNRVEFKELNMDQLYDTSLSGRMRQWGRPGERPELPPELIVSNDGVYWLAERNRWISSAELTAKDFETFIEFVRPKLTAS